MSNPMTALDEPAPLLFLSGALCLGLGILQLYTGLLAQLPNQIVFLFMFFMMVIVVPGILGHLDSKKGA